MLCQVCSDASKQVLFSSVSQSPEPSMSPILRAVRFHACASLILDPGVKGSGLWRRRRIQQGTASKARPTTAPSLPRNTAHTFNLLCTHQLADPCACVLWGTRVRVVFAIAMCARESMSLITHRLWMHIYTPVPYLRFRLILESRGFHCTSWPLSRASREEGGGQS